jgi:hypothetical protein
VLSEEEFNREKGGKTVNKPNLWLLSVMLVVLHLAGLLAVDSHAAAIRDLSGFTANTLAPNDDGSTGLVPIGFEANLFGLTFTNLFVNNNGNVTITNALSVYTPFPLTSNSIPIIAPFFADVDTAAAGSPVTYGTDTVNGHPAFGVDWINVDYFASSESHTNRNSFQLVMIDRSDIAAGDFDFEFNYDQIQWEAGTASGSDANGLGGNSARAGYSNGSNTSFEIVGSAINGAFLDSNSITGLVHRSFNSNVPGRFVFQARGGTVLGACSGIEGFEAQISGLGISASQERMLFRSINVVNKAVQRRNFLAARKDCDVFHRKVQALVRMGLIDQSTASSLVTCCATLASPPAPSDVGVDEEIRLQALKGRLVPR